MAGFNVGAWQSASDTIGQNQGQLQNNNAGWLDRVLGRVDDGFDVYDRVRCAANPSAPGCYQSSTGAPGAGGNTTDNTWAYVGLAVVVLLLIGVLFIALKK